MANMNTLFRKGYLLAGVMMAANMFVVNEVKAMEEGNTGNPFSSELQRNANSGSELNNNSTNTEGYRRTNKTKSGNLDVTDEDQYAPSILDRLLFRENIINFFGGLVFSGANNYFKWWDYNPGIYFNLGCLGWRTKKFFDIVQLDFNLNLGRGALWTTFFWLKYPTMPKIRIIVRLIVEFISIPLAIHIHGFDISIALDSILFTVVNRNNLSFLLSRCLLKDKDEDLIDRENRGRENYYPYQQNNDNINVPERKNEEKLDGSSSQQYMNNSAFLN